ncbi:hypothetical protein, partial [Tsukamurella paurometabola]
MVLPGTDEFDGSAMFGSCDAIEQECDEDMNGSGRWCGISTLLTGGAAMRRRELSGWDRGDLG